MHCNVVWDYSSLLLAPIEVAPIFGFWGPFCLFGPFFGKKDDFLAAQPPQRPFDRPVRWYLRYLRARDAQSATLPLVYVTCGGSNLPVRPQKRPRVPAGQFQNGPFSTPGARFFGVWACFSDSWEYAHQSLFRVDPTPPNVSSSVRVAAPEAGACGSGFWSTRKAIDGHIPMGPKNVPKRQKSRSWR